jgi:ABC-2 type transport system permease protein
MIAMSWHKIWLVLRREYVFNFRRPSFLFTAFGVPALSLAAMFLIFHFMANKETNLDNYRRIGYIDQAGVVTAPVTDPKADYYGYQPVVNPDQPQPPANDQAALAAYYADLQAYATQQVLDNKLDAFFVIGADYVLTGQVGLYSDRTLPKALTDNVESFLQYEIAAHAPNDLAVPAARLGQDNYTLRDLSSNKEISETALVGRILLPFIFVMIYFMATSTTAQFLMSGVVEEKEDRLMEILATSLRPLELLWGKLLGLGALALTQVGLWTLAGVAILAINQDARDFVSGATFRAGDLLLLAALFVINFLVFSASMLGLGASVTAEAESRQLAGIFTFLGVLPIMFLATFLANPNGPLPIFFMFFPLTAAVGLILRMGMTSLPTWQIALSIAIQVISVIVVMWLAAKMFRLGMLMYGKRLTPRQVWQALREGRTTLTTAADEYVSAGAPSRRKGLFGR